jgi:transcription antitermination factor NusG
LSCHLATGVPVVLRLSENPPLAYSSVGGELLTDVDWKDAWRVAYTKPRQEKSLAHDLVLRGVTYFLPMVVRETSSGGRRRRNYYPLFPSYLFFAGDDDATLACRRTERLVQVIDPPPEQQPLLQQELRSLATALASAPERVELYNHLRPGTPVWVKSGPMRGIEGLVLEMGSALRLQLAVTVLGVGAVVEIHPDLVERL